MNSSSSTLLASVLKTLLENLDIPEELHIVSIGYTAGREKMFKASLHVEILYLPEEKKK